MGLLLVLPGKALQSAGLFHFRACPSCVGSGYPLQVLVFPLTQTSKVVVHFLYRPLRFGRAQLRAFHYYPSRKKKEYRPEVSGSE